PGGERIGGEALVDKAERAQHVGIGEFLVKAIDLRRQQQALVNDSASRQRRDVEKFLGVNVGGGDFALGALADDVQLALERGFVHVWYSADKNLLDVRLGDAGDAADDAAVDRGIAPAEDRESFFARDALQDAFAAQ